MKLVLIVLLLVCLVCNAVPSLAESPAALPDLPDRLPVEYKTYLKEAAGTVKKIEYPSRDYTGDGSVHAVPRMPRGPGQLHHAVCWRHIFKVVFAFLDYSVSCLPLKISVTDFFVLYCQSSSLSSLFLHRPLF